MTSGMGILSFHWLTSSPYFLEPSNCLPDHHYGSVELHTLHFSEITKLLLRARRLNPLPKFSVVMSPSHASPPPVPFDPSHLDLTPCTWDTLNHLPPDHRLEAIDGILIFKPD